MRTDDAGHFIVGMKHGVGVFLGKERPLILNHIEQF